MKNLTAVELHEKFAHLGVTPRLARQIQSELMKRNIIPEKIPGASEKVLNKIRQITKIPNLKLINKVVSAEDAFAKYLFCGEGQESFETVRIPLMNKPDDPKYVVCVSCQVGCSMGCKFCATGQMGFHRNLNTWEIVDQVLKIQADSSHPIRGVVFMGMGEPMLNYDAVMQAAKILSEPCGLAIGAKSITISTVGIISGIRRYTKEKQPYRLVVSLTSANPAQRQNLMPVEKTNPISELIKTLYEYHQATRIRVTLAWIMISGINTSEKDAAELAELTRGLPVKIDLIDVNDPSGKFNPPSAVELKLFRNALRDKLTMPFARRYSGGKDINAACGMLAGRNKVSESF